MLCGRDDRVVERLPPSLSVSVVASLEQPDEGEAPICVPEIVLCAALRVLRGKRREWLWKIFSQPKRVGFDLVFDRLLWKQVLSPLLFVRQLCMQLSHRSVPMFLLHCCAVSLSLLLAPCSPFLLVFWCKTPSFGTRPLAGSSAVHPWGRTC